MPINSATCQRSPSNMQNSPSSRPQSPSAMRHAEHCRTQLPQPLWIEFEADNKQHQHHPNPAAKCRIDSASVTSRSPHGPIMQPAIRWPKYRSQTKTVTAMGTISAARIR